VSVYVYLQKVQVDFVARTAEDIDGPGIRNLLQQVDCVNDVITVC